MFHCNAHHSRHSGRVLLLACLSLAALAAGGCDPKPEPEDRFRDMYLAVCELNAGCAGAEDPEQECGEDRICFDYPIPGDTQILGAHSCIAALRALTCDAYLGGETPPKACDTAFLHLAAKRHLSGLDGPCRDSLDCSLGLFCSRSSDDESCGVCLQRAGRGEACSDDVPCAGGTRCTDEGVCRTAAAQGEACESGSDCAGLLSCVAGTCQLPSGRVGDACDQDDTPLCMGALACVDGVCTQAPGEGDDCSQTSCGSSLVCVDEICVAPAACGTGQVGDPCYGAACAAGLKCDLFTSRCIDPASLAPIGAACRFAEDCQSDACENGACVEELVCRPAEHEKRRHALAASPSTGDRRMHWSRHLLGSEQRLQ